MAPTVAAIVPTYNEEAQIGQVLAILSTYSGFHEIVVVDCSSDRTPDIVARYANVRYLKETGGNGKGHAMNQAVQATTGDILFFCDADIMGLTHEIIDALITPVRSGTVDMTIAVRGRRISFLTRLLALLLPRMTLIAGERAVRRTLWEELPASVKAGFQIETALNFYADRHGRGFTYHLAPQIRQVMKEKKYGLGTGVRRRLRMFGEMSATWTMIVREEWSYHARHDHT